MCFSSPGAKLLYQQNHSPFNPLYLSPLWHSLIWVFHPHFRGQNSPSQPLTSVTSWQYPIWGLRAHFQGQNMLANHLRHYTSVTSWLPLYGVFMPNSRGATCLSKHLPLSPCDIALYVFFVPTSGGETCLPSSNPMTFRSTLVTLWHGLIWVFHPQNWGWKTPSRFC